MFFDKELRRLKEEKSRIRLRCELRRRLVPIEVQSIRMTARRSLGLVTSGIAASAVMLDLFRVLRRFRQRR